MVVPQHEARNQGRDRHALRRNRSNGLRPVTIFTLNLIEPPILQAVDERDQRQPCRTPRKAAIAETRRKVRGEPCDECGQDRAAHDGNLACGRDGLRSLCLSATITNRSSPTSVTNSHAVSSDRSRTAAPTSSGIRSRERINVRTKRSEERAE